MKCLKRMIGFCFIHSYSFLFFFFGFCSFLSFINFSNASAVSSSVTYHGGDVIPAQTSSRHSGIPFDYSLFEDSLNPLSTKDLYLSWSIEYSSSYNSFTNLNLRIYPTNTSSLSLPYGSFISNNRSFELKTGSLFVSSAPYYLSLGPVNNHTISTNIDSWVFTLSDESLCDCSDCDEPSGSLSISENGSYDVSDYAEAIVDVPVSNNGGGDYHDDLSAINNTIMIGCAVPLVIYFFYSIYRLFARGLRL